jgi:hypothetical protein
MRRYISVSAIILMVLFCWRASGQDSRISPRFQTVYILSMSNSLDQHLASRLTSGRVLWVVLDPASADAVMTDNVDGTFWDWLARTYPGAAGGPGNSPNANQAASAAPAKQRGTIFLIDPRRRLVLWSIYELPKSASPAELDRSATRITNQLKVAFGKK